MLILSETENYKISLYNQDSDIVFITFGLLHSNLTNKPFGLDFCLKQGWNVITVQQSEYDQYQNLSLEQFHDAVFPFIQNKKVFVYGCSLGGYCSIYYGGIINATIISASPRNSMHRIINHPRFKDKPYLHKEIIETPKTSNNVYIIYDPNIRIDFRFINELILPHYPQLKILPIINGTHLILETLLKLGLLKETITSIVEDDFFTVFQKVQIKNLDFILNAD